MPGKLSVLLFGFLFVSALSAQPINSDSPFSEPIVSISINHFQNTASIQFEENDTNEYVCRISDEKLKLIMKFLKRSNKTTYLIPLDHLRRGIYLLTIQSGDSTYNFNFQK